MRARFLHRLIALASLVGGGCATDQPTAAPAKPAEAPMTAKQAPTPDSERPAAETHTLNGTIESIRFQNINKARGRFTYNVELTVRVASVDPPPTLWRDDYKPEKLRVRVAQGLRWSSVPAKEQAALAPDGPKPQLNPERWRAYASGESVELKIRVTSVDLAHLVSP